MSLAAKLALYFEKPVQFKGIALVRGGQIRVADYGPGHLDAAVQGTNLYPVHLKYDAPSLEVSCGCAYFDANGECKHLWAAILEADRIGALGHAAADPNLRMEEDYDAEISLPPLKDVTTWAPAKWDRVQLPAWQEHLTAIRNDLESTRRQPAHGWPRDFEVLYAVDLGGSKSAGHLTIHMLSRARKKNGEWSAVKDLRVTPETAGALPDPMDAEIATVMLGGRTAASYGYDPTYGAVGKALPPHLALRLVPMMSTTGRLFSRPGTYSTDLRR